MSSLSKEEKNKIKEKISKVCVHIHMTLIKIISKYYDDHKKYYYVTPSSYIDLLKTFGKIFEMNKNEYIVRDKLLLIFLIHFIDIFF